MHVFKLSETSYIDAMTVVHDVWDPSVPMARDKTAVVQLLITGWREVITEGRALQEMA